MQLEMDLLAQHSQDAKATAYPLAKHKGILKAFLKAWAADHMPKSSTDQKTVQI